MKIKICCFLSFVLATSCVQKVKVKTEKNEIGGLTKKVINEKIKIIVDSIFDSSGQLNTVVEYFKPGHIKTIKHYKNGNQDSAMLIYYYSGIIKSKKFFYSGKECFERIDFSESGKINDYIFLSSDQTHFY